MSLSVQPSKHLGHQCTLQQLSVDFTNFLKARLGYTSVYQLSHIHFPHTSSSQERAKDLQGASFLENDINRHSLPCCHTSRKTHPRLVGKKWHATGKKSMFSTRLVNTDHSWRPLGCKVAERWDVQSLL